jgi:hypothetical protein
MTNKHSRVPNDASSSPTGNHHHHHHAASRLPPPAPRLPPSAPTTPLNGPQLRVPRQHTNEPKRRFVVVWAPGFFFSYIFYYLTNVSLNIGYKYVVTTQRQQQRRRNGAEPRTNNPAPAPAIASHCSHGGERVLTEMTRKQRNDQEAPETSTSLGPYVDFLFFVFSFISIRFY